MAWCNASVKAIPILSPATGSLNWRNCALNWARSTTSLQRGRLPVAYWIEREDYERSRLPSAPTGQTLGPTGRPLRLLHHWSNRIYRPPWPKRQFEFSRARHWLLYAKKHVISHDRQESGGKDSGDGQVRGFYRPKNTWYHMIVRRLVEGTQVRVRWGVWWAGGGSGVDPPWVLDSLPPRHPWNEDCDWRTRR